MMKKNKEKRREYQRNRCANVTEEKKIRKLSIVKHGIIDKVKKNKLK